MMDIQSVREVNDEIQEAVSSGHTEGISSALLKLLSDLDHAVRLGDFVVRITGSLGRLAPAQVERLLKALDLIPDEWISVEGEAGIFWKNAVVVSVPDENLAKALVRKATSSGLKAKISS